MSWLFIDCWMKLSHISEVYKDPSCFSVFLVILNKGQVLDCFLSSPYILATLLAILMYYLFKIKIWGWRKGSTHKQEAYLNPPVCLCRSLSAVGPWRCLTPVIPRHPCGIVHVLQRRDLGSSWMTEGCNIQKLGRTRNVGWLLSWVFPITSYSFFLRGGSAHGFEVTVTTVTSRDSEFQSQVWVIPAGHGSCESFYFDYLWGDLPRWLISLCWGKQGTREEASVETGFNSLEKIYPWLLEA